MQGIFSARRLAGLTAAVAAMAVFAAPAMAADRNDDGLPDRWERKHELSLKHDQAKKDQDSDGLKNRGEFRAKFDPRDDDSDDDGVEDGDEGAGAVASFDPATGELAINLFGGDTVSGLVTDETEIECENDDDVEPDDSGHDIGDDSKLAARSSGDDDAEDGGHSGSGHDGAEDQSGSGHGGQDADDDEDCDVTALQPGAVVREAETELTTDGLVFEEIELR